MSALELGTSVLAREGSFSPKKIEAFTKKDPTLISESDSSSMMYPEQIKEMSSKENHQLGKKYCFKIIKGERTWLLSANSEKDMKLWIQIFNLSKVFRGRTYESLGGPSREAQSRGNALITLSDLYYHQQLLTKNEKSKLRLRFKSIHALEKVIEFGDSNLLIQEAINNLELLHNIRADIQFIITGKK